MSLELPMRDHDLEVPAECWGRAPEKVALEARKRSGACKRRRRLSQKRKQGFARDVGTEAKQETRGWQKTLGLSQERNLGLARDVAT